MTIDEGVSRAANVRQFAIFQDADAMRGTIDRLIGAQPKQAIAERLQLASRAAA